MKPDASHDASRLPLDGVSVVEIGGYIAAPLISMMLADLGADVIKVEAPPKGDPHRNFGYGPVGSTMAFVNCNRNKRSVVLDLKDERQRSDLLELVRRTDIVVISTRPKAMQRLGLGDDELEHANPRAIRLYVTGYGESGPRSDDPAFDAMLQAVSGLAYVQGGGEQPTMLRTFIADKLTAVMACQSVIAALYQRTMTNEGARLSVAMLDAVAYFNFPDVFSRRTDPETGGSQLDGVSQAARPIRTNDGWILATPVSGAQIGRAFEAFGRPELRDELKQFTDRGVLAQKLFDFLESCTEHMDADAAIALLRTADVPAAPVLSLDQHLSDPQVVANGTYGWHQHPQHGRLRDVQYPVRFGTGDRPPTTRRPAPSLGEHSDEILSELAISPS